MNGRLAGVQAGDRVWVPGRGLRFQRAVLASGGTGELFVDTLKNKRARTVPLVDDLVPIVDRWAGDQVNAAWLFHAPQGGPLSEGNWKRSVRWSVAIKGSVFPASGFTTCGILPPPYGSTRELTRMSFSASWDTLRRP